MDKLTKRALQAQVEAAVRLQSSNGLGRDLPSNPTECRPGKQQQGQAGGGCTLRCPHQGPSP